jgi:hypothetical protein
MAREIGFPARVVMGFAPEVASGATEIRGSDVSAWIEVDTAQYGWVTLDPNPEPRDIPAELPEEPVQVARPQTVVPPAVLVPPTADRQPSPDTEQRDSPPDDAGPSVLATVLYVSAWTALGLGVAALPFLVILGAKARRRRRRRRATTSLQRIRGAWDEFQDRVVDHAIELPPSATRGEVAEAVGGAQPVVFAAFTDRAVFAPTDPDDAEADGVWRAMGDIVATLDRGKSRWQRFRVRISLRSFGGYAGSSSIRR